MKMKRLLQLTTLLTLASALVLSAQDKRPRIAVGGLRSESNSLYPATRPMRETPAPGDRKAWMTEALKASTVASGVVEASQELDLDLYPIVRGGAGFLGSVETESFDRVLNKTVETLKTASPPYDGIILNAGAYTHTSIAISDAISAIESPVIEVHISNVYAREAYRHHSMLSAKCEGVIAGLGLRGYELAVQYFL